MVGSRADRQDIDWNPVGTHKAVDTDVKCLASALDCVETGRDVLRAPNLEGDDFETERAGCGLNLAQLQHGERVVDIAQDREMAQARNDLSQQLDPLAGKVARLD